VTQASPRGSFLMIAEVLRDEINENPHMEELPPEAALTRQHGVSRGVVQRAFKTLRDEGLAVHVPGAGWRVVRAGERVDRRPLADRMAAVIVDDGLSVGAEFPSEADLSERFGVSRPTVRAALARLEGAGLVGGGQGKRRIVRALPKTEEHP